MFFYIHIVHKTLYNIQITYGVVCSKTMHIYMNIVKCMYNVHGMHCTMYNAYHAHIHRLYIYIRVHILNVQIHILIDPFPLGTEF